MSGSLHTHETGLSWPYELEAGFTLIEVMVTLILVSLLSLVSLAAVYQLRNAGLVQRRADATVEVEALADTTERILSGVRQLPLSQNNPGKKAILRGDSREISLVSATRLGAQTYGLVDVRIFNDLATNRIMLETRRRRDSPQTIGEAIELSKAASIRFEYIGAPPDEGSPISWLNSWSELQVMPRAVRIEISISRSGEVAHTSRIFRFLAAN